MGDVVWDDDAAAAGGVVWDDESDPPREKQIGAGSAFLQGAGQMASGGFMDEIGGAVSQFFMPEGVKLGREFDAQQASPEAEDVRREALAQQEAQPSRYQQARGLIRDADADAQRDQGAAYTGGQAVGLGLSILAPVPKVLASPTIQGGLYGLGSSRADLTEGEFGEAAFDTGVGAATGKAVGMAGNQVAKAVRPVSKWVAGKLGDFAGKRAVKAAGAIQKDLKKMSPEQIVQRGNDMLDDGLIPFGADAAGINRRASAARAAAGEAEGAATKSADEMGERFGQQFNMEPVLARVNAEILEPLKANPLAVPGVGKVLEQIRILANAADSGVGYEQARIFKTTLDEGVNWRTESKLAQRLVKKLRSILDDETERQMGTVSPDLRASFEGAKRKYGTAKKAEQWSADAVARKEGNRWLSLTDYLGGIGGMGVVGAGAAGGGPLGALGGALFNKLMRERGSSALAVMARSMSRLADRSDAVGKMANKLAKNPDAFGRFGPMLMEAALKGPEEVVALHAALSSDPAYLAALQQP